MKKVLLVFCFGLVLGNTYGQDSVMFRKIADEILLNGTCYTNLKTLCKTVGNRLSGSPAAAKAVEWGRTAMTDAGFPTVLLQPVDVPVCYIEFDALSLGNSKGTGGKALDAEVIEVGSFEELETLSTDKIKGKIVFFNYKMKQNFVSAFDAYGDAVKYRWAGASAVAAKGAVGLIIRSISTGEDDYPHTGSMRYVDSIKKVPEMAVGNRTADKLAKKCKEGTVWARMQSECGMVQGEVRSYNVIGEIKGSQYPDRIITVGGHLDSWDVGEGAQDDGTGCVQSIEVLRTFIALGIRPKYTIRAVLFMNEENGLKGGEAYCDSAIAANEHHVLAIETDGGAGAPRGMSMEVSPAKREQIIKYKHLFMPYNVYDFTDEGGGADISPLKRKLGVPCAGLMPESQRYFDYHHTWNDVFETVNHRELKLGAVTLAQFIYLVDQHEIF
ncbi:MAG: M20/M25/M40 family metallo-hydrolase [Chitinophagia bacterium]|nr:M20/M25/M40 family metallo-hydrolase [Chitinophagia bacterium]